MGGFSFFTAMFPLDFAGLSLLESLGVLAAAAILLPLFQSFTLSLSVFPLSFWHKHRREVLFPLSFSLALTLFFLLQNFTWAGVPWALPCLSLVCRPVLIQSASLFGSGFLTLLMFLCNALLGEALLRLPRCNGSSLLSFSLAVLLFGGNLLFGFLALSCREENTETLTVAALQADISSTRQSHIPTSRIVSVNCDLAELADEENREAIPRTVTHTHCVNLVGAYTLSGDAYYNALFLFDDTGNLSPKAYHKRKPVPFGEYLPMRSLFSLFAPALTEINMLEREVTPGTDAAPLQTPFCRVGCLICFDSLYPALARADVKSGADFLAVSTNDSWFDGSFAKKLHFSHTVLRAVETGRYALRAGNTGLSGIVSDKGEVVALSSPDERTYVAGEISLCKRTTLYTLLGDVPLYASFAVYTLLSGISNRKKRKERLV
ncbi:MAG: apolipoprotein N-acyltransferase [Clostridia bacterium]|nr:apolipoprotein N-acyltransferase [Clostridia bacterium]